MRVLALLAVTGCLYETTTPSVDLFPSPPHDARHWFDGGVSSVDATVTTSYAEHFDLANDYDYGGDETTQLNYLPGTSPPFSITGAIDTGSAHYDATFGTIDVDNFQLGIVEPGTITFSVVGDFAAVPLVTLRVYAYDIGSAGSATWSPTDPSVTLDVSVADYYELGVAAFGSAGSPIVTGPAIPYTILIQPD